MHRVLLATILVWSTASPIPDRVAPQHHKIAPDDDPGRLHRAIIALNFYYAKPGRADEVLNQRLLASNVREKIGLPRGRILRRVEAFSELPDVIWECEYPDLAAHDHDMDARAASPEFEAVRARMGTLIRRFERVLWEVQESSKWAPDSPATVKAQPPLQRPTVVVLDLYYARPGKADEVSNHRRHASDVREKLGLPRGRVLRRLGGSDELPDVIWECEHSDEAARERDVKALAAAPEWRPVREHMDTLTREAQRALWQVADPPR